MNIIQKVFGTHSQRELKRIEPIVDKIESLIPEMMALSDEALRDKTKEYKKIIKLLMKDEEGIFIFTSGNDDKRFRKNIELYEEAKKYLKNQEIYMMNLDETIKYVTKNCTNAVIFFVGSFYIYNNVVKN